MTSPKNDLVRMHASAHTQRARDSERVRQSGRVRRERRREKEREGERRREKEREKEREGESRRQKEREGEKREREGMGCTDRQTQKHTHIDNREERCRLNLPKQTATTLE